MQIINTLKCNFSCRHCLGMCSPKRKEVLDNHTLTRFMMLARGWGDDYINYCGGETFLNPDWRWQIEFLSRQTSSLRIVTNGSKFYTRTGNETSLLREFIECLYSIQYNCKVTVIISNDEFHQEFYYKKNLFPLTKVIESFKEDIPSNVDYEDDRRIHTGYVAPLGRALKTECYTHKGSPYCETFEPSLNADGRVYACCNMRMEVGSIWDGDVDTWLERHGKFTVPNNCLECKFR